MRSAERTVTEMVRTRRVSSIGANPLYDPRPDSYRNSLQSAHEDRHLSFSISSTQMESIANTNGVHRHIIGNYELGKVLAMGDFDCRTRLCTHVTTGVQYVVRIYDRHVLAEAQWMWDRVAESIQVQRTLPRSVYILEMVECFESNASVYILMHLFSSVNLTKLFTDAAVRAEVLARLHLLSRTTISGTAAMAATHMPGEPDDDMPLSDHKLRGPSIASHSSSHHHNAIHRESSMGNHTGNSKRDNPITGLGEASSVRPTAVDALRGDIPSNVPLVSIRALFEQVVKGVLFLHQHNVAHTGIAPDHLLVSHDGQVRLGNMISCCFCQPGERLHELRGTMHTVAPEVLRGEAYDPFLSDAWALGVVLYFMLNRGRYPHDGANTLRHILHGQMRPSRPGLPAVATDLMSRLLQPLPEERLPVHAVLAHSFFTATLPTIKEEMAADAVQEAAILAATRNARRSTFRAYQKADRRGGGGGSIYRASFHLGNSMNSGNVSGNNSNVSTSMNSSVWRRGGGGDGTYLCAPSTAELEKADTDVLDSSWSARRRRRSSAFVLGSDSSTVVAPVDRSTTAYNLEGTATIFNNIDIEDDAEDEGTEEDLEDEAEGDIEEKNDHSSTMRRHPSFPDDRPLGMQLLLPRLTAAPRSSSVSPSRSGDPLQTAVAAAAAAAADGGTAPQRPRWRPEQTVSMADLEDLAARIIQYHFREAYRRRRYRAETQALIARSQMMQPDAADTSREVSVAVPLSTKASAGKLAAAGASAAAARRASVSASVFDSLTVAGAANAWKRQESYRARPPRGSIGSSPLSTSLLARARWPPSRTFNGSVAGTVAMVPAGGTLSGSTIFTAAPPPRARSVSSSVTVDTHHDSFGADQAENGGKQKSAAGAGDSEEELTRGGMLLVDEEEDTPEWGRRESAGSLRRPRLLSFMVPGISPMKRSADQHGGGETSPPQQQRTLASSRGTSTAVTPTQRRPNAMGGHPSLLHGHRSRERVWSGVPAVGEAEVCPLCHRSPYSIRSITRRPYATTPYHYTGSEFQRLLEE